MRQRRPFRTRARARSRRSYGIQPHLFDFFVSVDVLDWDDTVREPSASGPRELLRSRLRRSATYLPMKWVQASLSKRPGRHGIFRLYGEQLRAWLRHQPVARFISRAEGLTA